MSVSESDLTTILAKGRLDQFQSQLDRVEGNITAIGTKFDAVAVRMDKGAQRLTALETWREDFEKLQGSRTETSRWNTTTVVSVVAILTSAVGLIIVLAVR